MHCINTNIAVAFLSLKIGIFCSCKDSLSKFPQSYVVYQISSAHCNACYIGETKRHLKTRIEEHLGKIKICKYSNIYKLIHIEGKLVIDCDNSHLRLKLEAMNMTWKMPILNKQIKHVNLTISV